MASKFLGGLIISERFFHEVGEPIITSVFPNLKYSAGLIGPGSEVLGFDTEVSTDHDWRPRFFVFLTDKALLKYGKKLEQRLRESLPKEYEGYLTHSKNTKDLRGRYVYSISSFLEEYLGVSVKKRISVSDWLTFDEHRLLGVTSGNVFRDDGRMLEMTREKIGYYPNDVWLYLLASQWAKISEEEAFIGRTGEVGDELGSRLIAARIVQSLMRLCFLMEKKYSPYSKWFGSAFSRLSSGKDLGDTLHQVLNSSDWKQRETALSKAHERVLDIYNQLNITERINATPHNYHERPYLVIGADEISNVIRGKIQDKSLKKLSLIGSVNQFLDSTPLLENDRLRPKLRSLYQ